MTSYFNNRSYQALITLFFIIVVSASTTAYSQRDRVRESSERVTTREYLQRFNVEEAEKLFQTGKYTECIEMCRNALLNVSYTEPWWILTIESLMELGKYEEAADQIDIALRRHSLSIHLLMLGRKIYYYNDRSDEAEEILARIYRYANTFGTAFWNASDLVALGDALLLAGAEPKVVMSQFYNQAIELDPDYARAYVALGDLAIDKGDYELAAEQYRNGLERFGDNPDLHYGLAEAFYHSDREEMIKSLDAALFINPNHSDSLLLLTQQQIDGENYDGAKKLLDKVISINPWNPKAWAYKSVLAHLENEPTQASEARSSALKYWSTNPEVDYIIGLNLSQKYHFAEGSEFQSQALKFDPDYLPARIQLAEDLLRLGEEEEGWKLAEQVYNQDSYNVQAYNLLNLRDHLSTFATLESGRFILRMDKTEAEIYGQEVLDLLNQAEKVLCQKYKCNLDNSVIFELFPNQQDFAVRTFGMPGVQGFLGVCFGNVVTANSPRGDLTFNWKSTLWHEFCHVVTLNLTKNKMPRWLSEGISVYEESERNPTCGQRMTPQYRMMILEGELTPISDLSSAFLSPPSPVYLQFAYYESMLVVKFIVDNYGNEALQAILVDLGEGKDINSAISEHTESISRIEKDFEAYAKKLAEDLAPDVDWEQPENALLIAANPESLAEWLENHPNSLWALTARAKYLLEQNLPERAIEPLNKLIELYPENVGQNNPYELLAEIYRNQGQTEQEKQVLEKLASVSSEAISAYGRLLEIAIENEDWEQVVENGEKYLAVNPMPINLHLRLGRANEELGRDDEAITAYRRLVNVNTIDPADLNYRLASLLKDKDPIAAKRHIIMALVEAPRFRQAHSLLLEIIDTQNQVSTDAGNSDNQDESPAVQETVQ